MLFARVVLSCPSRGLWPCAGRCSFWSELLEVQMARAWGAARLSTCPPNSVSHILNRTAVPFGVWGAALNDAPRSRLCAHLQGVRPLARAWLRPRASWRVACRGSRGYPPTFRSVYPSPDHVAVGGVGGGPNKRRPVGGVSPPLRLSSLLSQRCWA